MRKVILWTVAAAFLLGVFGTAILSHIQLLPALPGLILILVVYIALYNGTAAGITAGFFSGLIFAFLSLAPMGLHSFVFTVWEIQCAALLFSTYTRSFGNVFKGGNFISVTCAVRSKYSGL